MPGDVPRVMIKQHHDGDPVPRPAELLELNAIRRQFRIDEILIIILTRDPEETTGPFKGYKKHDWLLRNDKDGEAVLEPTTIDIEVVK